MAQRETETQTLAARHGLTPRQNAVNAAIAVAVAVPWSVALWWHVTRCGGQGGQGGDDADAAGSGPNPLQDLARWWCRFAPALHPVALVNFYFAANVCALFWVISLLQGSTWLIDPYWTIVPVGINYVYQLHPEAAAAGSTRSLAAEALVWVWAARLTHSYFRREEWNFGAREDWRFAAYRRQYPTHWWWMQVFVCYASQQLFLVGITLPLYFAHFVPAAWGVVDVLAVVGCLAGIAVAAAADTQLHAFVTENERRAAAGRPKALLLDSGVWRYSRHPNYFGEQLFWWSLGLFAARVGHPWALAGAAVNTACLFVVTGLVEERMRAREDRRAAFDRYVATTSMWIPLPKFGAAQQKTA